MDLTDRTVTILGGTGLVGMAIARRMLDRGPAKLVLCGLREEEARASAEELRAGAGDDGVEIVPEWGDVFLRKTEQGVDRAELLAAEEGRARLLADIFDPMDEEVYRRSSLCSLLERHRPEVLVDCINTATAIAYQDVFSSAEALRCEIREGGAAGRPSVERHLTSLYLPQLIRHIQLLLEGTRRTGTKLYLKIGTSGTGGMGLNVPFTHSEERPSATLLAKSSVAGAHSLLLFLMARTPSAPAVKEIKPTAAIAWKEIAYGPIRRGGKAIPRVDATEAVPLDRAFGEETAAWRDTGEPLESVYLDAGENGLFSLAEFETISALRMMELVTPEEIADTALRELEGRPTGREVVGAIDAAAFGPTYRAGVMREAALRRMEELEREHGVRSVAFEMLGPPRLSKLLFEAALLERIHADLRTASDLDPDETAAEAGRLVEENDRLRSDVLSIGLPILLPDGERLLRGPRLQVRPEVDGAPDPDRWARRGWVDLRPASWRRWRERCRSFVAAHLDAPGPTAGSGSDLDVHARSGAIRPGSLAAHVFRTEDRGERTMR